MKKKDEMMKTLLMKSNGDNKYIFIKALLIYLGMVVAYIALVRFGYNDYLTDFIYDYSRKIRLAFGLVIIIILSTAFYFRYVKKIVGDEFLKILLEITVLIGMILRIAITLSSDCRNYSYDMGESTFDVAANEFTFIFYTYGHGGYIMELMEGHLPQSNFYQFYQQPLFYILGGITSKIVNVFIGKISTDIFFLIDPAKIVSCLAGCLVIYVARGIINHYDISLRSKLIAISFVAFHPGLILNSSRISVDMLTMLFMAMTLLYTIRWYENPSWKNIMFLAISYGLAAMTKISGVLFAPITLIVFAYAIFKRKIGIIDFIKKFAAFLFVSLPLGLWYNVRNYIKFDQPFGYYFPQSEDMSTFVGENSLVERFLPFKELFSDYVVDLSTSYNFHSYFYKTSLFGPIALNKICPTIIGVLLFYIGIAVATYIFASIAYSICKFKTKHIAFMPLILTYCYLVSMLFYFKEPYTCSMEFRYMSIIVIPISVVIGIAYDKISKIKVRDTVELLLSSFYVMSAAFYLVIDL